MASGKGKNKTLMTGGLMVLLLGSAVAAQAPGGAANIAPELAAPILPLIASIGFALNRKQA